MGIFDFFRRNKPGSAPRNATGGAKQRILVVDDEADIAESIATLLRHNNYEVSLAATGPDGIIKAKNEMPDLILLDVTMPGLNGFEVSIHLKKDPKTSQIPILILTALQTGTDMEMAFQFGADAFITKPYRNEHLLMKVQRLLKGTDAAFKIKLTAKKERDNS